MEPSMFRMLQDASYPFLIQGKYRAGYFTHYAGKGTVRSAKVCYNGEEVDLCLCRTHASFSQEGNTRILTLDPVDIEFYDLTVKIQTKIYFEEGAPNIKIERNILEMSNPEAEVTINEYYEYNKRLNALHVLCKAFSLLLFRNRSVCFRKAVFI